MCVEDGVSGRVKWVVMCFAANLRPRTRTFGTRHEAGDWAHEMHLDGYSVVGPQRASEELNEAALALEEAATKEVEPKMENKDDLGLAKDLIARGYKQVSRASQTIARLPEGETALEALKRSDPCAYRRIIEDAERLAADYYRRMLASEEGNTRTLSVEEFAAFKKAGGEASW